MNDNTHHEPRTENIRLKTITVAKTSQVFTGVPVYFKQVFMGVNGVPSLERSIRKTDRSGDVHIISVLSSVSLS